MNTQINLRMPQNMLTVAKEYARSHGFSNIQEFIKETVREKLFEDFEVRSEYLEKLNSKDANTFLSESETEEFEKELEKRAKLK